VLVTVRVTPRAAYDAIEGVDDAGAIRVRVTAPPADGAANKAVITLLAKAVGVPQSGVALISGAASRHKRVRIEGLSAAAVLDHWPGASLGGR
jgi:uncharacterized protein (TIGR00251 family)